MSKTTPTESLTYGVKEWAAAVGIAPSTVYQLAGPAAPRRLRIGTRVVILEAPAEYLRRLEQLQSEAKVAA